MPHTYLYRTLYPREGSQCTNSTSEIFVRFTWTNPSIRLSTGSDPDITDERVLLDDWVRVPTPNEGK